MAHNNLQKHVPSATEQLFDEYEDGVKCISALLDFILNNMHRDISKSLLIDRLQVVIQKIQTMYASLHSQEHRKILHATDVEWLLQNLVQPLANRIKNTIGDVEKVTTNDKTIQDWLKNCMQQLRHEYFHSPYYVHRQ